MYVPGASLAAPRSHDSPASIFPLPQVLVQTDLVVDDGTEAVQEYPGIVWQLESQPALPSTSPSLQVYDPTM